MDAIRVVTAIIAAIKLAAGGPVSWVVAGLFTAIILVLWRQSKVAINKVIYDDSQKKKNEELANNESSNQKVEDELQKAIDKTEQTRTDGKLPRPPRSQ